MPVVTTVEIPGVTRKLYEKLGERMARHGPPTGIIFHSCGEVPGGWRIIDVWSSKAEFDRFVDERLLPAAAELQLPAPSRRECFSAHHAGMVN